MKQTYVNYLNPYRCSCINTLTAVQCMNATMYSGNNRFCVDQSLRTDSKSTVITGDGALEPDPEFTEKNYKFSRY